MKKIYINFKILFLFLLLSAITSKESFAILDTTTCSDENGLMCWKCGSDCTATLYDGGKLIFSGTGAISVPSGDRATFQKSKNSSLPQAVTSVKIGEGITQISQDLLWGNSTVTKIELADSVKSIAGDALNPGTPYQLILSENSSIISFDTGFHSADSVASVFCRGDVTVCRSKLEASNSKFQNKTITDELRDSNNRLLEKCSSAGCRIYEYNSNGDLRYVHDNEGNILESYKYDAGGNLISSYKNGVVTYRRRIYTPAEATAAVQNGGKNNFSLTFR